MIFISVAIGRFQISGTYGCVDLGWDFENHHVVPSYTFGQHWFFHQDFSHLTSQYQDTFTSHHLVFHQEKQKCKIKVKSLKDNFRYQVEAKYFPHKGFDKTVVLPKKILHFWENNLSYLENCYSYCQFGQNILIPKRQWRELDFARPETAPCQTFMRGEHKPRHQRFSKSKPCLSWTNKIYREEDLNLMRQVKIKIQNKNLPVIFRMDHFQS